MDELTHNAYETRAAEYAEGHCQADVSRLHALLHRWLRPAMEVLEIGGGAGREAAYLRAHGVNAWLSDGSEAMLAEAVRRYPELAAHTIHAAFPLPEGHSLLARSFDGITALAVLMHLPDDALFPFAFQARRLLRPEGILVLSTSRQRPGLSDDRDAAGRLFHERAPGEIRLLFERLGFCLLEKTQAPDARGRGIIWDTLTFRLARGDTTAPVDQIETIISRDRKTATYKLALLRALADIAQTEYHQAAWHADDTVSVPLGLIAERWLLYYWPLVEADLFANGVAFPQQRGGETGRQKTAFRPALLRLTQHFSRAGGLDAFFGAFRADDLSDEVRGLVDSAVNSIARTVVTGPVRYAGGALADDRPFFWHSGRQSRRGHCGTARDVVDSLGRVHMRGEVWRELCLLGHWIGEALILRWAELTHEISKGRVSVANVVERLLVYPNTKRDQGRVRDLYVSLQGVRCVWTDVNLTPRTLAIDHVVPFSLWHNNDVWNLLPASRSANSQKRDALVGRDTLFRRRDAIIGYWEQVRGVYGDRFDFELRRTLLGVRQEARDWKVAAFRALDEALETLACQRGLERWEAPNLAGSVAAVGLVPTIQPLPPPEQAAPAAAARFVLLPFFAELRIACGVAKEARAEYASVAVRIPPVPRRRLVPDRHFVVRAEGDSMDGGNTPIRDGDYLVLEWIDAAKAGSLTAERAIVVELGDDTEGTSYVLKQIRKDSRGRYWLHSWNRSHSDTLVDPSRCRPRARFVSNLGREAIDALPAGGETTASS